MRTRRVRHNSSHISQVPLEFYSPQHYLSDLLNPSNVDCDSTKLKLEHGPREPQSQDSQDTAVRPVSARELLEIQRWGNTAIQHWYVYDAE